MVYAIDIRQDFVPATKIPNLAALLYIILPLLTLGAALIFLVMSLYAGFIMITGGDNKEKIAEAQKTLGFAVIGLVVVAISFIIVKIVGFVLGVTNILPI